MRAAARSDILKTTPLPHSTLAPPHSPQNFLSDTHLEWWTFLGTRMAGSASNVEARRDHAVAASSVGMHVLGGRHSAGSLSDHVLLNLTERSLRCDAGSYMAVCSLSDKLVCVNCAAGKKAAVAGSYACTECTAGSYADEEGAKTCTECAAGTYSPTVGATSSNTCSDCPGGRYSDTNNEPCTRSDPGYSAGPTGATTQTGCTAGTFALANASSCSSCLTITSRRPQPGPLV